MHAHARVRHGTQSPQQKNLSTVVDELRLIDANFELELGIA